MHLWYFSSICKYIVCLSSISFYIECNGSKNTAGRNSSHTMLSGPSYSLTPPIAYRTEQGFDPQI